MVIRSYLATESSKFICIREAVIWLANHEECTTGDAAFFILNKGIDTELTGYEKSRSSHLVELDCLKGHCKEIVRALQVWVDDDGINAPWSKEDDSYVDIGWLRDNFASCMAKHGIDLNTKQPVKKNEQPTAMDVDLFESNQFVTKNSLVSMPDIVLEISSILGISMGNAGALAYELLTNSGDYLYLDCETTGLWRPVVKSRDQLLRDFCFSEYLRSDGQIEKGLWDDWRIAPATAAKLKTAAQGILENGQELHKPAQMPTNIDHVGRSNTTISPSTSIAPEGLTDALRRLAEEETRREQLIQQIEAISAERESLREQLHQQTRELEKALKEAVTAKAAAEKMRAEIATGKNRSSMLKIIGGLASAYGAGIHGERIDGLRCITTELDRAGVSVGDDTVRKILRDAAQLTPPPKPRQS